MKKENNHEKLELLRVENARVLTYMIIYVVLLAMYMFVLREIPFSSVLPILVVMFMHFFYIKYGSKNEISPLYNYSPIWSSVSILFFVLIFISELFVGKENFTWVIGVIGAMILAITYLVTLFVIFNDVG
jgi:hypothetical protein